MFGVGAALESFPNQIALVSHSCSLELIHFANFFRQRLRKIFQNGVQYQGTGELIIAINEHGLSSI